MVNVDTNIIAIRRNKSYLFNKKIIKGKINSDSIKKFYETDIIGMIELFCIENIFFSSLVNVLFQQTVGIHMDTNCGSFLIDVLFV